MDNAVMQYSVSGNIWWITENVQVYKFIYASLFIEETIDYEWPAQKLLIAIKIRLVFTSTLTRISSLQC